MGGVVEKSALNARSSVLKGEGHGVNGSTSVSKTESLGSNPSAPASIDVLLLSSLGALAIRPDNLSEWSVGLQVFLGLVGQ